MRDLTIGRPDHVWRTDITYIPIRRSFLYLFAVMDWGSRKVLAWKLSNCMDIDFCLEALQDAPYMAIYECFDSFAALERYLDDSGPDLEPAARLLIAEYCKYTLYRAWYYYPGALPPEVLSPKQREANGHIDPKLSFPLEDLYPDGQPAGQVGQEIYGAGAAFIFATRAFHHVEGAPFRLYCNHFLRAMERKGDHALTITLDGGEMSNAGLSVVGIGSKKPADVRVTTAEGKFLTPYQVQGNRTDYRVPANGRLVLTWE